MKQKTNDNRTICVLLSMTLIVLAADMTIHSCIDPDTMWGVAMGRSVLEEGITGIHPTNIDKSLSLVIQAWPFNVLEALADNAGIAGLYILGILNTGALFVTAYAYMSMYRIKPSVRIAACSLLTLFSYSAYVFKLRPENITTVLLLLTCIGIEEYNRTGHKRWLILLPVTTFLEANLHCSMIVFHPLIVLAYCFPSVLPKVYRDTGSVRTWKKILPFAVLSVAVAWLNPYGTDGVLYLLKSFTANSFAYIQVSEMQSTSLASSYFIELVIVVALLFFLYKEGKLYSHETYLAAGFGFLVALTARNCMFLYLVFLVLGAPLLEDFDFNLALSDKNRKGILVLLAALLFIFTFNIGQTFVSAKDETMSDHLLKFMDGLGEVEEHIRKDSEKPVEEIKVYTGFNFGSYFEYMGYKNIFMDARPEIYTEEFNKTKNVIAIYREFDSGVYLKDSEESDIEDLLSGYGFDYIVIEKYESGYLKGYLDGKGEESGYMQDGVYGNYTLYKKTV